MVHRFFTALLLGLVVTTPAKADTAYFAGGCFWCMEAAFQEQAGVHNVVSGFTGGELKNPTYQGDHSGHFEAIRVEYDPEQITYSELLDLFWRNIDPFDNGGQFCDRGFSYRSALFPVDDEQQALAQASAASVVATFPDATLATEIRPAGEFWPVEEYHQDYYLKNPVRYKFYRWNCGRDQRLNQLWGNTEQH